MRKITHSYIRSVLEEARDFIPDETLYLSIAQNLLEYKYTPSITHSFLEIGHISKVNETFANSDKKDEWIKLLIQLIEVSKFQVGNLIEQRSNLYKDKNLFQIIVDQKLVQVSYKETWEIIQKIAKSLAKITENHSNPVIGIFTSNSLFGALLDLACLSFHFCIVPIPVMISKTDLNYILNHAGITHLFIEKAELIDLFSHYLNKNKNVYVSQLPNKKSADSLLNIWEEFLSIGIDVPQKRLTERVNKYNYQVPATIMYTSGTTANPKGIIFSQQNIISKRFCRALALPSISSNDVFLCYLPLYHTFGRYLELIGTIFWGATYVFAESPDFSSLLKNFSLVKPTVFISIPKRWIQLYDKIQNQFPQQNSHSHKIKSALSTLTGGRLSTGLSAAGYLDPDIFIFYRENGVNLLSGYGMTEATGGITMTPVDEYLRDSVGRPLPGIDTKIADDGELLIRGAYVSPGYFGEIISVDHTDNWLHTGDIFQERKGHLFFIDRKKEIYKNSQGQTISPQKIENLFQDFESITSVFLVGDGREFNTALIYPDFQNVPFDMKKATKSKIRDYFSSIIQSINSFLAPFERLVNYAIIQRDFTVEFGELTKKETYKRSIILKNFSDIIEPMYEKNYTSLLSEEFEIRISNWIIREKGIIPSDLHWDGQKITIRNSLEYIEMKPVDSLFKIGDFLYSINKEYVDFESLLVSPKLWIGNQKVVDFIGLISFQISNFKENNDIKLHEESLPWDKNSYSKKPKMTKIEIPKVSAANLKIFHELAVLLLHKKGKELTDILQYFQSVLGNNDGDYKQLAQAILIRLRYYPSFKINILSFELLLPYVTELEFLELLMNIQDRSSHKNKVEEIDFDVQLLQQEQFDTLLNYVITTRQKMEQLTPEKQGLVSYFLAIITQYGVFYPHNYIWVRVELMRWEHLVFPQKLSTSIKKSLNSLTNGFRNWIGVEVGYAIEPNSDKKYYWKDVVSFDKNVEENSKVRLLKAIENTALLREAVFLFSNQKLVKLTNLSLGGVWIYFLGRNYGKSVFRILVMTKSSESYNFVINLDESLGEKFIKDEIRWLITTGSSIYGSKLVEDFGGYWQEYNLYTEEYIPGETLFQYLERFRDEISSGEKADRWQMRWLHFIWNGLMAYMDFWYRTGFTLFIPDPSTKNLIIPKYDYAIGTRLISISNRKPFKNIADFIFTLYEGFIIKTEKTYEGLKRMGGWEILFSALLQVVTVKKGLKFLQELNQEISSKSFVKKSKKLGLSGDRINSFIDEVNENGLLTKQIIFASLRYQRWLDLNPHASKQARGSIIQELYKDYGLRDLLDEYPETRIRFFLMTCFKDTEPQFFDELLTIQKKIRAKSITSEELGPQVHHIHNNISITEDEEYFLARLLFDHLKASEGGELVLSEKGSKNRVDFISIIEDNQGDTFRIRSPLKPKEIASFHTLLGEANLFGTFLTQHEFLLLFDSNKQMAGGVYWRKLENSIAYIEKIVIRYPFRKRHLSLRLLEELFNRLKNHRYKHVSVGFFQAGLFYKLGFQINKKFGGLVKKL